MSWVKSDITFEAIQQRQLVAKLMHSVKLFEGLTSNETLDLLAEAEKSVFAAGDYIIQEGERGAFMYVIVAGKVEITKWVNGSFEKPLAEFGAGDSFGEMALVDNLERSASVKALTPCTLLRLSDQTFRQIPAIGAKIYRNIACLLSQRLRNTNAMISLLMAENDDKSA
jgi:CRP-like cAMP-binding protein